jgi:hypothetical protein
MADSPLENATLVLLTPAKARKDAKTHIKIIAPEDCDFGPDTNVNNVKVADSKHTITWTATLLKGKKRWLKYSIKAGPNRYSGKDLPDSGTITVTLPQPPVGVNPVVTLHVDYVDEVDEP